MNTRVDDAQFLSSVACTTRSVCATLWWYAIPAGGEAVDWLMGRTVLPLGQGGFERELRFEDGVDGFAFLRGNGSGFTLFWNRNLPAEGRYTTAIQELDARLSPRGPLIEWQGRPEWFWGLQAGLPLSNGYAILWLEFDLRMGPPECDGCAIEAFLTILDQEGNVRRQERVNDRPYELQEDLGFGGALAIDGAGRLIAVFSREVEPESDDTDVFVRRFSPEGVPLGPPLQVNAYTAGAQHRAQVVAAPGGDFVVVWQSAEQDGELDAIVARRFGADGLPLGPEFIVNDVTSSAQRSPRVTMNEQGDFAVAWQSFDPNPYEDFVALWDVKLRLFRADGTPVGGEILVNQTRHNSQTAPYLSFAPNGTLLVGWRSFNQPNDFSEEDVYSRRFAASPGVEVCWLEDGVFRCDLGRTGGRPELRQGVGWMRLEDGEVPLLGDVDGDGRADLCAWKPGLLRCDLDHEGRPAEVRLAAGRPGDVPLLGDVDGDGRADPCLRRSRWLRCDPGHNGAERRLYLGLGTETPVMGDLDGDGRDDLCVVAAGVWRCRTWTGKRFRFTLGGPGASPALGDLDGDGRADPCVLQDGQLLCDTRRDGHPVALPLELPNLKRIPLLLGNLDGL